MSSAPSRDSFERQLLRGMATRATTTMITRRGVTARRARVREETKKRRAREECGPILGPSSRDLTRVNHRDARPLARTHTHTPSLRSRSAVVCPPRNTRLTRRVRHTRPRDRATATTRRGARRGDGKLEREKRSTAAALRFKEGLESERDEALERAAAAARQVEQLGAAKRQLRLVVRTIAACATHHLYPPLGGGARDDHTREPARRRARRGQDAVADQRWAARLDADQRRAARLGQRRQRALSGIIPRSRPHPCR